MRSTMQKRQNQISYKTGSHLTQKLVMVIILVVILDRMIMISDCTTEAIRINEHDEYDFIVALNRTM